MDRSVVWEEIDSILAAIDPNRASWVALLDSAGEDADGPNSAAVLDFLVSLEDWAALNRLEEVIPGMLNHGFDCASFINGVISEPDLQEMGIRCPVTRRKFLAAAADLPRGIETVAASLTQAATVETFLQRLCLQQHLATDFADLRLSLVDCLAGVTDAELREKYRIRKLGHRRRILRCLSRLPPAQLLQPQAQPPHLQSPQTPVTAGIIGGDTVACSNAGSTSSSSSTSGNFSSTTAERTAASAPVQPPVKQSTPPQTSAKPGKSGKPGKFDERAAAAASRCRSLESVLASDARGQSQPQPQPPTFRPVVKPGWPHHPKVLLGGSVAYSVSYLGFRPLENHTDRGELGQVMQTFRCKSADILKLPQICLSVCYLGVKFVNPDNEMLITEHRITDIYCACQDNTRRSNFAYVTKDCASNVHYCHCFASHSQDAAVLIINTLSEACSLANQLIEFNQMRGLRLSAHRASGADCSSRKRIVMKPLEKLDCVIDHF